MTKNKLWIIPILAISIYLRFSTLPRLMVFTPDEAYQAYITMTLIKSFHIIWIGLSAGAYNLYLGPLWNYIIYPFLYFSHGDPISLGYAASILGVASTFMMYVVGKKIFSEKVGLISSLIYASSPLLVYYDQKGYPSGITLLSLLIVFSLYMTRYKSYWWIVFTASFAMIFHTHLSLLPVFFVAIYWAIKGRKKITLKSFIISLVVFLTLISPLIAFDYFHHGSNISAPLTVLKTDKTKLVKFDLTYHLTNFSNSLGRLVYLKPYNNSSDEVLYPCTLVQNSSLTKPFILVSGIILVILIYFLIKPDTWKNEGKRLIALLSLSIIIPFIVFQFINPIEYYLLGFYPLLILIIVSVIESLNPKIKNLSYLIIAIMVLLGIFTVTTAKDDYGLSTKKGLIEEVMNTIGTSSFDLSEEGNCHKYESWRYLYSIYGRKPNQSSEDPIFGWLYPSDIVKTPAVYSIIMKETRSSNQVPNNFEFSFQKGGFTALIYKN